MERLRKVEFRGTDKDGKEINGMIRSESKCANELRLAILKTLGQAGIDAREVEVMGLVPFGDTRIIQVEGEGS